jgi:hypothetical protein
LGAGCLRKARPLGRSWCWPQRNLPQALAHTPKVIGQTIDATGWSKLAEITVD